ncbi:Brix-domain-containing protein [Boletus reticuloceps]|uniref:Brix-domain-containing protein n=1 Tax=Boletus reticuloceps TaxID=495285 RepID=A0A8I2YW63_9AGAM|nr:Brix-domain-containing protein [Boletus reticuloceps]
MGRRRKNRTHLKGVGANSQTQDNVPKSFIIKHGQVGPSLTQLVRDLRKVMEPNTASRLRERNRNKLKDFLTMAPALKVSHLMAITLTDVAPSLRIVRLPTGPTFSFRIERYSLRKDLLKASRSSRSQGLEYLTAPLLVLASFPPPSPDTPPHLPLLMKAFQSMFPPLAPNSMSLSGARRIVLIAYNAERGTIDFRHYLITVKPYGVSKRVRRVLEGAKKSTSTSTTSVVDLGNEKDVADFLLRKRGDPGPGSEGGYESAASSASSAAGDDVDAVSLADDYVGRNNKKGQKKAVKLDEVGPRMELRLVKITEGVPGKESRVMYHEFVKKSKVEAAALKTSHAAKEKLRKQRREEQEENVRRKKEANQKGPKAPSKETSDRQADGSGDEEGYEEDDGGWDAEEEISDINDDGPTDSEEESEEEFVQSALKKTKYSVKR